MTMKHPMTYFSQQCFFNNTVVLFNIVWSSENRSEFMETEGKVEARETKRKRTEKNRKRLEEDEKREKAPNPLVDKKEEDSDEEPCCSQSVSRSDRNS